MSNPKLPLAATLRVASPRDGKRQKGIPSPSFRARCADRAARAHERAIPLADLSADRNISRGADWRDRGEAAALKQRRYRGEMLRNTIEPISEAIVEVVSMTASQAASMAK